MFQDHLSQYSLPSFHTETNSLSKSCARCPQLLNTNLTSITWLFSAQGFCCSSGKHLRARQHLNECECVLEEQIAYRGAGRPCRKQTLILFWNNLATFELLTPTKGTQTAKMKTSKKPHIPASSPWADLELHQIITPTQLCYKPVPVLPCSMTTVRDKHLSALTCRSLLLVTSLASSWSVHNSLSLCQYLLTGFFSLPFLFQHPCSTSPLSFVFVKPNSK